MWGMSQEHVSMTYIWPPQKYNIAYLITTKEISIDKVNIDEPYVAYEEIDEYIFSQTFL